MNQTCWDRNLVRLLLLALVLSVTAPRVWGWGEKGHVIVAMLAERHVNQSAKKGIVDLLGKQLRISDPQVAVWADLNRRKAPFDKQYPDNEMWHFVDIPFDAKDMDAMRDCKNSNCVLERAALFQKLLSDPNAQQAARIDALKFLVHFVGDMHQPLHCVERNNDRGGNDVKIHFNGKHDRDLNLHALWDSGLVDEAMNTLTLTDYVNRVDADITSDMKKQWGQGDFNKWAWDSHQLAVQKGYVDSRAELFPPKGPAQIDDAYLADRKLVVEEQLKKAGIRLANVLNDSFK